MRSWLRHVCLQTCWAIAVYAALNAPPAPCRDERKQGMRNRDEEHLAWECAVRHRLQHRSEGTSRSYLLQRAVVVSGGPRASPWFRLSLKNKTLTGPSRRCSRGMFKPGAYKSAQLACWYRVALLVA